MASDIINLGPHGKKPLKEYVTPHKMALLVLIKEYSILKADSKPLGPFEVEEIPRFVFTEREKRDFMLTALKLLQSGDIYLAELAKIVEEIARPTLFEKFSESLKVIYEDGIKAIMEFFKSLLEKRKEDEGADSSQRGCFYADMVNKSSVIGLFIRRMSLAFDKLSFSQVTKLYARYAAYYQKWADPGHDLADSDDSCDMEMAKHSKARKADPIIDMSVTDHSIMPDTSDIFTGGSYSQRQAEFFIAQQSSLLHHNESEALSPALLQEKIRELLNSNRDLAEAHYLSYMNNLRISEYCGAMDSLFHYFDRSSVSCGAPSSIKGKVEEDQSGRSFRYAALNLAALHYRFGHRHEALAAVQEAIRIAQETNDSVCLQHALGWLTRLGEQATSYTAYLLDRSISKAGEQNLSYLTSLGVQAFARHNAVLTAKPSSVFEFLMKSDILNIQHSQADLMCVSYAQKAGLWDMYGDSEMCSLMSQLLLHVHTADAGIHHEGEAGCMGLCNLVMAHAQQGEYSLALDMLSLLKARFPPLSQLSRTWKLCEQQLGFERALLHGRWHSAEQAVLNMAAISEMEANYRKAILLKEKGEVNEAFALIENLLKRYSVEKREAYAEYYARLLLVQAELYCQTNNATSAGLPLLSCLTLCQKHHLSYRAAIATLHLAHVQFCIGMPSQAMLLNDQVLITVLCNGGLLDQARALYLLARCQVAVATQHSDDRRRTVLQTAVQTINTVIELFKKMEAHLRVKDAIYYQARLYHELGYTMERNKCALQFRQLDQQYTTHSKMTINVL